MDIKTIFTESRIGLLEEAFNIAAGNAVTALSQILRCDTDMSMPVFKGVLFPLTSDAFDCLEYNGTYVETHIVGELQGELAVVVPDTDEKKIVNLIRQAREEQRAEGVPDSSIIIETGNILAGTFLTAIHDFCGLNVFHTIPIIERSHPDYLLNKVQSCIDEGSSIMLVVNTEFTVNQANIKAYMIVVLGIDQAAALVQAIEKIRPV